MHGCNGDCRAKTISAGLSPSKTDDDRADDGSDKEKGDDVEDGDDGGKGNGDDESSEVLD